jgi:hypothetical protein
VVAPRHPDLHEIYTTWLRHAMTMAREYVWPDSGSPNCSSTPSPAPTTWPARTSCAVSLSTCSPTPLAHPGSNPTAHPGIGHHHHPRTHLGLLGRPPTLRRPRPGPPRIRPGRIGWPNIRHRQASKASPVGAVAGTSPNSSVKGQSVRLRRTSASACNQEAMPPPSLRC